MFCYYNSIHEDLWFMFCVCRLLMCNAERDFSSRTSLHQSAMDLFLCKHLPLGNSCMSSFYNNNNVSFIITQTESWYTFYHTTEVKRLSQPRWLVTYWDILSACKQSLVQVVTGPGQGRLSLSTDGDKCAMVNFLGGSIKSLIYKSVNFVHKFNN